MIPTSQSTFEEADFLRFANEEMQISVMPMVMGVYEEYYVTSEELPLVANQSNYAIPYRAAGNKLRDLKFKDSNGNLFELSRISREDRQTLQGSTNTNAIRHFYLESGDVVIYPTPNTSSGTLVLEFYMRPNQLVSTDRAATITAIDFNTGTITVDQIPSNFTTSSLLDLLQKKSPHKVINTDIPITTLVNTPSLKTITVTNLSDLPSSLVVGDYLCSAEESIIPQIPSDLHSMIAQRVACRCLEALGDAQGLQLANAKLAEMQQTLQNLIDNRVEGAPMKVSNAGSILRNSRMRKSHRGY
jgi:hypothetical protein